MDDGHENISNWGCWTECLGWWMLSRMLPDDIYSIYGTIQ
jgi:hypothetical protein